MNLKFLSFKNLSSLILLFSIFILDRISKIYVITLSGENFEAELYESTFLNIILIWNKGIAFGLLSFDQSYFYNLITIFITLIIFILIVLIFKSENLKKYSYILVTGGALGNLFDRIIYNSVPDFIDIHYNELHWFIFNIADIFITIGIILIVLRDLMFKKK